MLLISASLDQLFRACSVTHKGNGNPFTRDGRKSKSGAKLTAISTILPERGHGMTNDLGGKSHEKFGCQLLVRP
jgi:hypothetical protein